MKDIIQRIKVTGEDTFSFYRNKDGDFTDARTSLHNNIIEKILSKGSYSPNKTVFLLGGATANGKSSLIRSGYLNIPANALKIDPDEIKDDLPEYKYLIKAKDSAAAVLVHEESSYLKNLVREQAIEREFDIVIDGVNNESFEKRKADVGALRANGHKIVIHYVTLDTAISIDIAKRRGEKTGRVVPEALVLQYNKSIASLVPALLEACLYDELYLWDTNEHMNPRLILHQQSGNLMIHNENLYNRFKNKANE